MGGLTDDVKRRKVFPNNSGRWMEVAALSDVGDNSLVGNG